VKFKPVPGLPLEISLAGHVRSSASGKLLKLRKADRYNSVSLRSRTYHQHRLWALAYLPNPNQRAEGCVYILNGNPDDLRAENLVWGKRTAGLLPWEKTEAERMYTAGSSLRAVADTFGVSSGYISKLLKGQPGGCSRVRKQRSALHPEIVLEAKVLKQTSALPAALILEHLNKKYIGWSLNLEQLKSIFSGKSYWKLNPDSERLAQPVAVLLNCRVYPREMQVFLPCK